MRSTIALVVLLEVAALATAGSDFPAFIAPGRADRSLVRRQGRDFGVFRPDCANAAGACNNACYYINCQAFAKGVANANRVTYIGPGGNGGEDQRNQRESGCQFENPGSGSVCRSFPFSQKFAADRTALDWQCDEWPPASSQQDAFANKAAPNSLRCIPAGENASLGAQLGNFFQGNGNNPGRTLTGPMARDDYFTVEFSTNIGGARFCQVTGPGQYCGNDGGLEIGLTYKTVQNGKIGSPYHDAPFNDNRYASQNTVYKDLFQCSFRFDRTSDTAISNVVLQDINNNDINAAGCTINNDGDVCTFTGLPNDLKATRRGVLGQPFDFEYSDNMNVNGFTWNSNDEGPGRGPATNDGQNNRYCRVTMAGTTETTECYFPCYESADGR